jgi:hypothetical protein
MEGPTNHRLRIHKIFTLYKKIHNLKLILGSGKIKDRNPTALKKHTQLSFMLTSRHFKKTMGSQIQNILPVTVNSEGLMRCNYLLQLHIFVQEKD